MVQLFIEEHFGEQHRRVLLVGGAGFDPRCLTVAQMLVSVLGDRLEALLVREQRPAASPPLRDRANAHISALQRLIPALRVVDVMVFEQDGAVGVGRQVVDVIKLVDMSLYTDIVVDFSALSIGSSFPITRLLLKRLEDEDQREDTALNAADRRVNLHAMVTARSTTDDRIQPMPSSVVGPVHGFQGRFGIDETARAAKLWLPQLRFGQRGILERLHDHLRPDDVVPVLPFPAHDPRLGDRLIEHYAREFERVWSVDARSIVYADERSPLDFYRTVLRIHDGRDPVFAETGGSLLILSPVGSKVLSLGGLMAAIERDLPVMYVEALSYAAEIEVDEEASYSVADVVHVWLFGEAYPLSRSALHVERDTASNSSGASRKNGETSTDMSMGLTGAAGVTPTVGADHANADGDEEVER